MNTIQIREFDSDVLEQSVKEEAEINEINLSDDDISSIAYSYRNALIDLAKTLEKTLDWSNRDEVIEYCKQDGDYITMQEIPKEYCKDIDVLTAIVENDPSAVKYLGFDAISDPIITAKILEVDEILDYYVNDVFCYTDEAINELFTEDYVDAIFENFKGDKEKLLEGLSALMAEHMPNKISLDDRLISAMEVCSAVYEFEQEYDEEEKFKSLSDKLNAANDIINNKSTADKVAKEPEYDER